jgi:hypothetical protein
MLSRSFGRVAIISKSSYIEFMGGQIDLFDVANPVRDVFCEPRPFLLDPNDLKRFGPLVALDDLVRNPVEDSGNSIG